MIIRILYEHFTAYESLELRNASMTEVTRAGTFQLGDLSVTRMGYGAMKPPNKCIREQQVNAAGSETDG